MATALTVTDVQVEKLVDVANMMSAFLKDAPVEKLAEWVGLLQALHGFANLHRAKNSAHIELLEGEISQSLDKLKLIGNA